MSRRKNFFKQSSNPFFSQRNMSRSMQAVEPLDASEVHPFAVEETNMTVSGAVNKSFILGAILLATAIIGWAYASPIITIAGAIGGLVVVLITVFKPKISATTAPIYAVLEGLFVGSLSATYASLFNGIVFQAILLTMSIFFIMLFIYKANIIPVTNKFRRGVVMATGAIVLVYVMSLVLGLFGIQVPFLHEGGMIGIGISLVIIGVASLNLLLDFDNFEKGEAMGAPKYMEWFFSMGLIITVVWLYVELLRLLSILSSD